MVRLALAVLFASPRSAMSASIQVLEWTDDSISGQSPREIGRRGPSTSRGALWRGRNPSIRVDS